VSSSTGSVQHVAGFITFGVVLGVIFGVTFGVGFYRFRTVDRFGCMLTLR